MVTTRTISPTPKKVRLCMSRDRRWARLRAALGRASGGQRGAAWSALECAARLAPADVPAGMPTAESRLGSGCGGMGGWVSQQR